MKRDKYNKSRHYSQSPSSSSSSESEQESELKSVKQEVLLPMGQGQVGIMSKIPGYPISQAKKPGKFGLAGLMTLPPAEGGAKKNSLMFCCLKCKLQQVFMSLMG